MQLSDILATDLLSIRPAQPALSELSAADLAQDDDEDASALAKIRQICHAAMQLCGADTVGVSIFHHRHFEELTWLAVVGEGEDFQGRRYPLRHSMCGVCFERESPQLFVEAQRYFQWLDLANIRIAEGLVVPLRAPDGRFYGTIWMVAHRTPRQFNKASVAILAELGADIYPMVTDGAVGFPDRFASQHPLHQTRPDERRGAQAR